MFKKGFSVVALVVAVVIIVGGVLVWQLWPEKETADWKIYTNEEYKFELKYPENWYELDNSIAKSKGLLWASFNPEQIDEKMIEQGAEGLVTIGKGENKENLSIDKWYENLATEDKTTHRYITISGIKSIESDGGMSFTGKIINIPYNNEIYSIKMVLTYEMSQQEKETLENIYSQILSTFRFLK